MPAILLRPQCMTTLCIFPPQDHCCILHSILGWNTQVGAWTRIEGTPNDPNPNKPFAKIESRGLFNADGRLNPSITVIGENVGIWIYV